MLPRRLFEAKKEERGGGDGKKGKEVGRKEGNGSKEWREGGMEEGRKEK